MMRMNSSLIAFALVFALSPVAQAQTAAESSTDAAISIQPAHSWSNAGDLMFLGIANAGSRLVAVGEHGVILLSDDEGVTFRQAKSVPVSSTLSAVTFADDQHGWAVGQWGVILATADGGETWQVQRSDTSTDQPFFSVYFKDRNTGWAVGLWSLLLTTTDGGQNWTPVKIQAPPGAKRADRNFFKIFSDFAGNLYICAEQGFVLISHDQGQHWDYASTGYRGSFWTGVAAGEDMIFVGGLRGNIYRSKDHGQSWAALHTGTTASITSLKVVDGRLIGVGLDGTVVSGEVGSDVLDVHKRDPRTALTGMAVTEAKKIVLITKNGIVPYDN